MVAFKEALMIDGTWLAWGGTGLCYILIFSIVTSLLSDYKYGHFLALALNLGVLITGNALGFHF